MEITAIFKIFNTILTVLLIVWGISKFPHQATRNMFVAMLCAFLLATLFFLPEDGAAAEWLRHLPFYIGQVLFVIFVTYIIRYHYELPESTAERTPLDKSGQLPTSLAAMSLPFLSLEGIGSGLRILTDEGMQHFLTLPIFLVVLAVVRAQFPYIHSKGVRQALKFFTWAAGALTMIHISEFIVENQELIPFLEGDPIELIEFFWFYLALFLFVVGIKRLPSIEH